jgi:YD repeat-containing protein
MDDDPAGPPPVIMTRYAYDTPGNRTLHEAANGVWTTTEFDALNRVKSIVAKAGNGAGTTIYDLSTKYDRTGNRRSATETVHGQTARSITWSYDGLYRLTGESWIGPLAQARTYTYDPAGNRLSRPSRSRAIRRL